MTFPKVWYFQNFIKAFKLANMGRAFLNSIIVLVCVLTGSILISSQVAVYKIMGNLHLIDHLYGYIIMMMGTDVISIYIFIQFMENISVSLDESAIIDGANYFTIYRKII